MVSACPSTAISSAPTRSAVFDDLIKGRYKFGKDGIDVIQSSKHFNYF